MLYLRISVYYSIYQKCDLLEYVIDIIISTI